VREREAINMAKTTKKDLVEALAAELETTKKEATAFLDAFETVVKDSIHETGDKVQLQGFLTIEAKDRAARKGRNPQTGESIDIPAKTVVTAKASFKI